MTTLRKQMLENMQLKGLSPTTQTIYCYVVQQLAQYYHKSPELISEEELRTYLLELQKKSARRTFQVVLAGIKCLYQTTLKRSWPVLELARPAKARPLPCILSRQEVRGLLAAVRVPVYRACLTLLYSCGLRIAEATKVQCGDIDSQRMLLRVRGKGNKDRDVPLAAPTLDYLRAFWKIHHTRPWLFPAQLQPRSDQTEGPISVVNLRKAFHRARQQCGITKAIHVHTLRHSYATHLMEMGVALRLIQEILGHRSPRTTAIYTHLTTEVLAQIKAPLQQLVQNL